jgi:cytochrome c5
MKALKIIAVVVVVLLVATTLVIAKHHTPEERGKALFNSTSFGNGTSGKACSTCHPDGKGLEGAGAKSDWKTPGGTFTTLEEAVNICVTMALKGKALDVKSQEMKDIVSYIKSLTPKGGADAPKKKPAMGC